MRKEFAFDYRAEVSLPFDNLLADPLLVLRNLPRVESIEKMDDLDYRVQTKPYILHAGLQIVGVSHVNLFVENGEIVWRRSQHHCDETCNGSITGKAFNDGHGNTIVDGKIGFKHPFINPLSWHFVRPIAEKIGEQFVQEFIQNFNDPVFENDVPA